MQQIFLTFSILFSWIAATLTNDQPQTISSEEAYKQQRACAKLCYWYGDQDVVASVLSCDTRGVLPGAVDSCYCRVDLQKGAVSYLSSCVESRCTSVGAVTVDVLSATGLTVPASIAATPTSRQAGLTTVVIYSTPTATSAATGLKTMSSEYGLLLACVTVSITDFLNEKASVADELF